MTGRDRSVEEELSSSFEPCLNIIVPNVSILSRRAGDNFYEQAGGVCEKLTKRQVGRECFFVYTFSLDSHLT
jgi:hypothetical protein